MSTRFIGFFPKNLHDIDELASRADRGLDIMCDYVGYGHYSDPDGFDRYYRKLQDLAARHIPVRMLVYTRGKAENVYDTQFTEEQFCDALTARKPNLVRFCQKFDIGFCKDFNDQKPYKFDKDFCAQLSPSKSAPLEKFIARKRELDALKEQFKALMFHKQTDYMEDLIDRGVKIRKTEISLPFYLWDEDDHEAVVSFLNEGATSDREVCFRTRDTSLVEKTFKARFKLLWDKGKDVVINKERIPDWLPGPPTSTSTAPTLP